MYADPGEETYFPHAAYQIEMNKRQRLMEAIREVLTRDKLQDYFCQHNGKFYRWEDIDPATWAPKPGSQPQTRTIKNSEIFRVGNLKVYF